jgi:hypothetical protein
MAIGHHINDRAHIIQKTRRRDGNLEEDEELINMDERKFSLSLVMHNLQTFRVQRFLLSFVIRDHHTSCITFYYPLL